MTISADCELSGDELHRSAVKALVQKFAQEDLAQYGTPLNGNPWLRPFVTGGLPDGTCCHVILEPKRAAVAGGAL